MPKEGKKFLFSVIYLLLLFYFPSYAQEIQDAKWRFITGGRIRSYPAIDKDGNCYFISDDRFLYSINEKGEQRWRCYLGERLADSLAIGFDGSIYVGHKTGVLTAVNRYGQIIWKVETGGSIRISPATSLDGKIFLINEEGLLIVISHLGKILYQFQLEAKASQEFVLDADNSLIIPQANGYLLRLSWTGKKIWSFEIGGELSSPAIALDGTIFLSSSTGTVYALSAEGQLLWSKSIGAKALPPIIDEENIVYFPALNRTLYAFQANGEIKWRLSLGEIPSSSCALGANGILYLASRSSNLFAINKKGKIIWVAAVKGVLTPLILSPQNMLYAGSSDWSVYAFLAYKQAESAWPVFQQDGKHSGLSKRVYQSPSIDLIYKSDPEYHYFKALLNSGNVDLMQKALDEIKLITDKSKLFSMQPYLLYLLYPIAGFGVIKEDKTLNYPFRGYSRIRHEACLLYTELASLKAISLLIMILKFDQDILMKTVALTCLRYLQSDPDLTVQLEIARQIKAGLMSKNSTLAKEAILCLQSIYNYHGYLAPEAIEALLAMAKNEYPKLIRDLALKTIKNLTEKK